MMDFSAFSQAMQATLGSQLPAILAATGILVVGYVIALLARASFRRLLGMIKLNQHVADSAGRKVDIENGIAVGVFWFVMLLTLVGVFNALELDQLAGPFGDMMNQITSYLPHLLAGVILIMVAWLLSTLVRALANRALAATHWDEKLSEQAGVPPVSARVGHVLYWLVMLMFLPAILAALQLDGLLDPVRNMVAEALAVLPNVFAAAIIVFAGWLVARVVGALLTNLLGAANADRLGELAGFADSLKISRLIGTLVMVLIMIPVLIAALDALQIEAVSRPASDMLSMLLMALPNIFAAALILVLTWFVARFMAGLIERMLAHVGANALPEKVGLGNAVGNSFKLSELVSRLMVFFAMLFATVEAAHRLDFVKVEELIAQFIEFGANVLLGMAILAIGFWLATIAHNLVLKSSEGKGLVMANITRIAILGLVLAMGLSAMGIADHIVQIAFALTLGAVAVAVALSFGLGGREAAGKQMDHWLSKLRQDD